MQSDDESIAQNTRRVLVYVMTTTLQLLHPFMPFITEEIWQSLPHEGESIMVSKWPESNLGIDAGSTTTKIALVSENGDLLYLSLIHI